MIRDFADGATRDIFHGLNSRDARQIPNSLWKIARRRLDMLNAAHELKDLFAPPGNQLEALKGTLKGFYSIRVNDQYRILFQFADGNARQVKMTDYH
ncbi:MAG: type II toxin-antitoxin system RelE/ParE family toxin [Elusimicrobia bacterium]|nr:type II toxin-antitoxin system RelE/ParE family toxin [Elusimicrobiota bacterium]